MGGGIGIGGGGGGGIGGGAVCTATARSIGGSLSLRAGLRAGASDGSERDMGTPLRLRRNALTAAIA